MRQNYVVSISGEWATVQSGEKVYIGRDGFYKIGDLINIGMPFKKTGNRNRYVLRYSPETIETDFWRLSKSNEDHLGDLVFERLLLGEQLEGGYAWEYHETIMYSDKSFNVEAVPADFINNYNAIKAYNDADEKITDKYPEITIRDNSLVISVDRYFYNLSLRQCYSQKILCNRSYWMSKLAVLFNGSFSTLKLGQNSKGRPCLFIPNGYWGYGGDRGFGDGNLFVSREGEWVNVGWRVAFDPTSGFPSTGSLDTPANGGASFSGMVLGDYVYDGSGIEGYNAIGKFFSEKGSESAYGNCMARFGKYGERYHAIVYGDGTRFVSLSGVLQNSIENVDGFYNDVCAQDITASFNGSYMGNINAYPVSDTEEKYVNKNTASCKVGCVGAIAWSYVFKKDCKGYIIKNKNYLTMSNNNKCYDENAKIVPDGTTIETDLPNVVYVFRGQQFLVQATVNEQVITIEQTRFERDGDIEDMVYGFRYCGSLYLYDQDCWRCKDDTMYRSESELFN